MMNLDIPYNIRTYVCNDLRDRPCSRSEMISAVEYLEQTLKNTETRIEKAYISSLAGVYCRTLMQLQRSQEFLEYACTVYKERSLNALVQAQLRLAHTYQWKQEYRRADALFLHTISLIDSDETCEIYRDFAYQHYGKSLFDQRRYSEAHTYFKKAYEIRVQKNNSELISSTQIALNSSAQMLQCKNVDISVVIPAFNEEKYISHCLKSIHNAFKNINRRKSISYEIIVSDNNSTDRTAKIAQQHNAIVVFEPINQISRSRNRGAAEAKGTYLLFVDADSVLHSITLKDLVRKIEKGYVGIGCKVDIQPCPLWAKPTLVFWNSFSTVVKCAAGSFVFLRKDVFEKIGGFTTELFAAEEIDLSRRVRKYAKAHDLPVTILKKRAHLSSGRKFHLYTKKEMILLVLNALIRPFSTLYSASLLHFFYDGRR